MADRATEQLLSSFADHLLRNQLADERHGRFMLHWVRRYLVHPPPVPNATPEELMDAYLGQLRKEDLKEWQLDQARQAITAWRAWSGGRNTGEQAPAPRVVAVADGSFDPGKTLAVLEHTLRLRHYSLRTLGTYLDWARRYFDYLKATNQITPADPALPAAFLCHSNAGQRRGHPGSPGTPWPLQCRDHHDLPARRPRLTRSAPQPAGCAGTLTAIFF